MDAPIPMILHCPRCTTQHVDAPDEARGWTNPPHRSHLCHHCGFVWRPADVPTCGVQHIVTKGVVDKVDFREGAQVPAIHFVELPTKHAVLSCPCCGCDDLETSPFPLNRERTEWVCRCGNPECGLELIAETAELAAERWNRRARWAQLADQMYRSKSKS